MYDEPSERTMELRRLNLTAAPFLPTRIFASLRAGSSSVAAEIVKEHVRSGSGSCALSYSDLAERARVSVRTVSAAIKTLTGMNAIQVVHGRKTPTVIKIIDQRWLRYINKGEMRREIECVKSGCGDDSPMLEMLTI